MYNFDCVFRGDDHLRISYLINTYDEDNVELCMLFISINKANIIFIYGFGRISCSPETLESYINFTFEYFTDIKHNLSCVVDKTMNSGYIKNVVNHIKYSIKSPFVVRCAVILNENGIVEDLPK